MTLLTIITDAAAKERARYTIGREDVDGNCGLLEGRERVCIFIGQYESCTAHLERLVAVAVLRAISEAGWAVVGGEPEAASLEAMHIGPEWRDIYRGLLIRNDLIPAMLAAAPDVLE